jgi:AAA+ ATPase superfamily predicted ATPase
MRNFRGKPLIDRENEMKFFLEWFDKIPDEVLWVFGPKSCGKTTLIEYIVENELFEDFEKLKPKGNYWVKYMNLRRYLISSYETFIEAFIKPANKTRRKEEEIEARISLGVFEINAKILNDIKERKQDIFKTLECELREVAKKNKVILIIDEIQTLEDIYINGDRELMKEFLNFCVALTKELHIAHVVILSSNTVFINRIYSDAKLKVTSRFYKINHLNKNTTFKWLKEEGFNNDDLEIIWEYLGGCIPLIQRMMRDKHEFPTLKEYLEHQKELAYSEIIMFYEKDRLNDDDVLKFEEIAMEILKNGYFQLSKEKRGIYYKTIEKFAEVEILFFDPKSLKVRGNNRLYEKGMELLTDN